MDWLLRLRLRRQGVDHFAGLGVVQLLARLVLDGVRIGLEPLDVIAQSRIFLLQILNLLLQLLVLDALLLPDRQPVLAVHHVPTEQQRQRHGHHGSRRPPHLLRPVKRPLAQWSAACSSCVLLPSCTFSSCMRTSIMSSKYKLFAAALSASISFSLRASV